MVTTRGGVVAHETRSATTRDSPADVRAREVEEQMTDDDRFSLLVSVCRENLVIPTPRDERTQPPAGVIAESLAAQLVVNPGAPGDVGLHR